MIERVRFATYNIHRCVGTDGRRDPGRVAEVISELEADVIGLQEVDSRHDDNHDPEQLEQLAELTGMEPVAGPTLSHGTGRYGNGLLTRRGVSDRRLYDLSVAGREPRGVLHVALDIGGRRVPTLVTHLGLRPFERRAQVSRLLEILEAKGPGPTVLCGDFNELRRPLHTLTALVGWFGKTPAMRSFPSRFPLLTLDRIFVRPRTALVQVGVHASRLARRASDHLPVWANLAFGTLEPAHELGPAPSEDLGSVVNG